MSFSEILLCSSSALILMLNGLDCGTGGSKKSQKGQFCPYLMVLLRYMGQKMV